MRGCVECQRCQHYVSKEGSPLKYGFCGWGTYPAMVKEEALLQVDECVLRGLPTGTRGVERAREIVRVATWQHEALALQFRGISLGQVCDVCFGCGVDPGRPRIRAAHLKPCPKCGGRGFHGERVLAAA